MSRLIAPTGHVLDLPARHLTFGEAPECDIPLTGGYGLAGLHFEIAPGTDGFSYLRDASGQAGTLVNGQPITVVALREGDVIQAGRLTLRFAETAAVVPPLDLTPLPLVPAAATPVVLPTRGEVVTAADAAPVPPVGSPPAVVDSTPAVPAPTVRMILKGTSRSSFAPASCCSSREPRSAPPTRASVSSVHWSLKFISGIPHVLPRRSRPPPARPRHFPILRPPWGLPLPSSPRRRIRKFPAASSPNAPRPWFMRISANWSRVIISWPASRACLPNGN